MEGTFFDREAYKSATFFYVKNDIMKAYAFPFLFFSGVAVLLFSFSINEDYYARWNNEFLHYSQVMINELIPKKTEAYYDSILIAQNPEFWEGGIVYEAEITRRNDTFWEAMVIFNYDTIPSGATIVMMAEGCSIEEAAETLISAIAAAKIYSPLKTQVY